MNAPLPMPQDSLHNAPGYAQLILTALRRRPDHPAFRWRDDGRERSLTYRATADMIERTAAALVCLRPAPGSAVALAEVVDERAPSGGGDVVGAGNDDAGVGVDLVYGGLDDGESSGYVRPHPLRAGFQLDRAFGDARRSDQVGGFAGQAGCGELVRLEAAALGLGR